MKLEDLDLSQAVKTLVECMLENADMFETGKDLINKLANELDNYKVNKTENSSIELTKDDITVMLTLGTDDESTAVNYSFELKQGDNSIEVTGDFTEDGQFDIEADGISENIKQEEPDELIESDYYNKVHLSKEYFTELIIDLLHDLYDVIEEQDLPLEIKDFLWDAPIDVHSFETLEAVDTNLVSKYSNNLPGYNNEIRFTAIPTNSDWIIDGNIINSGEISVNLYISSEESDYKPFISITCDIDEKTENLIIDTFDFTIEDFIIDLCNARIEEEIESNKKHYILKEDQELDYVDDDIVDFAVSDLATDIVKKTPQAKGSEGATPKELEESSNTFWSAYDNRLLEFNLKQSVSDYLAAGGNINDIDSLADSLPDDKSGKWYKTHKDKLKASVDKIANPLGGGSSVDGVEEIGDPNRELTNKLAIELANAAEDGANAVTSAEAKVKSKYDDIEGIVYQFMTGRALMKHAIICGQPGIGKTYTIMRVLDDFGKSSLAAKGWKVISESGSLGKGLSTLLAYFYQHRDKCMIVLDDCDDFLTAKEQQIVNFLKALLDNDNTEENPKFITSPASIRKIANGYLENSYVDIYVDKKAFKEGILHVTINDQDFYEEMTERDRKLILESKMLGKKMLYEDTDDEWDDDIDTDQAVEYLDIDDEEDEIPARWRFASRILMISNLYKDQIDSAVYSRVNSYELKMTNEEILTRIAAIIKGMLIKIESEASAEEIEHAKMVAYGNLLAADDLVQSGRSVTGIKVKYGGSLTFRVIQSLSGKWLSRYDAYIRDPDNKKDIEGLSGKKLLKHVENRIQVKYFVSDVIPELKNLK